MRRYGRSRTGGACPHMIYTQPMDFAEAAVIIHRSLVGRKAARSRKVTLKTEFARAKMRSDMLKRRGSISLPVIYGTGGKNTADPHFTPEARNKRMRKASR